jgi:hypothetical protein
MKSKLNDARHKKKYKKRKTSIELNEGLSAAWESAPSIVKSVEYIFFLSRQQERL